MNQFRAGLTRIRNLAQEKFPDAGDLFGYPGITKHSLLTALDSIYVLSQEITDDDRFEIQSLKRSGSALYRTLKEFLESGAHADEQRGSFNGFLDALSELIEKTRMTYFIVVKQGIRNDEELATLRSTADELLQSVDELKEKHQTVTEELEGIAAATDEINARHERTAKQAAEIKDWHEKATSSAAKMEQLRSRMEEIEEEVAKNGNTFDALAQNISKLASEATTTKDRLDKVLQQSQEAAKGLELSGKQHSELLEKINLALEDANRIGMASSFKARKDELRGQQSIWTVVFLTAIGAIVAMVWHFVLPTLTQLQKGAGDWTHLVAELGLVTPLIWLGWFAAKQYGYTSRIREDYAFKSAAAMAYEGHKKAARESDQKLEQVLLEFALFNMSQNPIRLYGDTDVHGSPVHEATSQLLDKLTRFKKIRARSPHLGSVEIVADADEEPKAK